MTTPLASRLATVGMIVRRSLVRHALSSSVTIGSAALASGLVMAVFSISTQSTRAFGGGDVGFDAVLGARGSALQLVLNTVYHLETSPGNLPWEVYRKVAEDPRVSLAIPYAVGDNYKGYRIVGTTTEIFTEFEYRRGRRFEIESPGVVFDPTLREAVVGVVAAHELGLELGSKFHPAHGIQSLADSASHEEEYTVIGVMKPTSSPSDRVIWIPIEGVFRMSGHRLRGAEGQEYEPQPGEEIPDEHKEVSAVMLKLASPQAGFFLREEISRGRDATLAWPIAQTMADLMKKLGWVNRILELVATLVVVVAAGSLLASLYNTMNERRREFAILRALGARKGTVFGVIVLEASTIAGLGALGGYLVYYAILAAAAVIVRDRTGVVLDLTEVHASLCWTPVAMIGVGATAGLLPALKAYSTDVAANLNRG